MLRRIAFWVFLFFFTKTGIGLVSQAIISVGGAWTISISAGGREREADMTIIQDGENIKVAIKNREGAEKEGIGRIKGNEIEWTEINKNLGREIIIIYKGKLEKNIIIGYFFPKDNESVHIDWKAVRKERDLD
jgi:hypothetical protein